MTTGDVQSTSGLLRGFRTRLRPLGNRHVQTRRWRSHSLTDFRRGSVATRPRLSRSGRVVQRPVLVPLAGEQLARVALSHRHPRVRGLDETRRRERLPVGVVTAMGALLAQNLQLSVVGRMMWAMTTSSRNRSKFDSRIDSGFAYLRARTLPQLLAILGASVIAPWGLFAVTPTPSNGLPPILELLYLSPIVAVLALVIPRFPLGRERILLVGIYAALVNYALADFAYMYWSMSQRSPGSFSEPLSHIDAAYFALGSFTTAGSSISALSALSLIHI